LFEPVGKHFVVKDKGIIFKYGGKELGEEDLDGQVE
jgi:hypothetical protein